MKGIIAVVAGAFLLASSLATADAAPGKSAKGIENSKKVMQHTKERYQQVEKVKKKARLQREAQRKQHNAAPPSGN